MNLLSGIYSAVLAARNSLYDAGSFRAEHLRGPVVSIGNISVGGAGKTPFTILLGNLLKHRGIDFDVISRGYGRATRGVHEVDPTGSPRDFGDEPLLLARALGVPVIVGEKRIDAGRFAEQKYGPRLHLLDDAFQHRQLARDFDIVLVSADDLRDRLLPAGRLREPMKALQRASVIVAPAESDKEPLRFLKKPLWFVRRSLVLPECLPEKPVAFCGIARPRRFFAELRNAGVEPAAETVFHDHHVYRPIDIRRLMGEMQRTGASGFITTEKDLINLGALSSQLPNLSTAGVRMELEDPDGAFAMLMAAVEGSRR